MDFVTLQETVQLYPLLIFMILGAIVAIEVKDLLSSVIAVGAVGLGPTRPRAEAAGGVEPGRSAAALAVCPASAVSGVSEHDLWLRVAAARRGEFTSPGHR